MSNKKKTKGKDIGVLIFCIIAILAVAAVLIIGGTGMFMGGGTDSEPATDGTATEAPVSQEPAAPQPEPIDDSVKVYEEIPEGHPVATINMENGKAIKIELYPEYAPQTVANFVALAESGFYDGLTFHRVVEGFMAQGGDPQGTGMGGSDKNIVGEFAQNGFADNTLSHTRGVISMARSQAANSASSQFFICYDDASFLDGSYAAFGKVVEGMENVDAFLEVERSMNEMGEEATPVEPIVMKSVTVER